MTDESGKSPSLQQAYAAWHRYLARSVQVTDPLDPVLETEPALWDRFILARATRLEQVDWKLEMLFTMLQGGVPSDRQHLQLIGSIRADLDRLISMGCH
ncbi:MAG: hypothetical protein GVY13_13315 [Alphaproteobacteria bacterium]|jgi:hypothetical protein|nr:hypothetical protein [Alphaproteobacteria bacterium]